MEDQEPEDDGMPSAPFWMTTYGDMVTLLLTFFILMFAMSSINEQKFMAAAISLGDALGMLDKNIGLVGELSPAIGTTGASSEQIDMLQSLEEIAEIFEEEQLADLASVEITGPGEVTIRLGDEVLYSPGEAILKPAAMRVLNGIAAAVIGKTDQIYVEGHTDNQPISTSKFPSNWELSSARALAVVRLLEARGVPPEQLAAVGHGEHDPIEFNDTPEGRAKNRRVELYIRWSDSGP